MNFGEMKTTVFSKIPPEKREAVSVFEFGEAIDAAQKLFAAILPVNVIPEIIMESFIDRSNEIGAEGFIPLPEDYLRAEAVHFAQARAQDGTPLRLPARFVTPLEFENLRHSGTEEQIYTTFNNLLHLHPDPVAAAQDKPGAIKLVYRKVPRPYMTTAGILQTGSRLNLRQLYDSRHTFQTHDYTDSDPKPFSFFQLDVNQMASGYAFIGASTIAANRKGPLYVCRIVLAWDENIGTEQDPVMCGHIRISGDDAIPYADEDPQNQKGFLFPWCYVTQRQVFGESNNAIQAEDWEFPELGKEWHAMICDYALSRIEALYAPQVSAARENRVFAVLSAVGARLEDVGGKRP